MYEFINREAADQLRAERIHHLEVQHYRLGLELEETPDNEGIKTQRVEVERRIEMHRRILGLAPLTVPEQENGQDMADDVPADEPVGEV